MAQLTMIEKIFSPKHGWKIPVDTLALIATETPAGKPAFNIVLDRLVYMVFPVTSSLKGTRSEVSPDRICIRLVIPARAATDPAALLRCNYGGLGLATFSVDASDNAIVLQSMVDIHPDDPLEWIRRQVLVSLGMIALTCFPFLDPPANQLTKADRFLLSALGNKPLRNLTRIAKFALGFSGKPFLDRVFKNSAEWLKHEQISSITRAQDRAGDPIYTLVVDGFECFVEPTHFIDTPGGNLIHVDVLQVYRKAEEVQISESLHLLHRNFPLMGLPVFAAPAEGDTIISQGTIPICPGFPLDLARRQVLKCLLLLGENHADFHTEAPSQTESPIEVPPPPPPPPPIEDLPPPPPPPSPYEDPLPPPPSPYEDPLPPPPSPYEDLPSPPRLERPSGRIEFHGDEIRYLHDVAAVLLEGDTYLFQDALETLSTDPQEFIDQGMDASYDFYPQEHDANKMFTRFFLSFAHSMGRLRQADWSGEFEANSIQDFARERVSALGGCEDHVKVTTATSMSKEKKRGEYILKQIYSLGEQLEDLGFHLALLQDGSDTYNFFIVSAEDGQLLPERSDGCPFYFMDYHQATSELKKDQWASNRDEIRYLRRLAILLLNMRAEPFLATFEYLQWDPESLSDAVTDSRLDLNFLPDEHDDEVVLASCFLAGAEVSNMTQQIDLEDPFDATEISLLRLFFEMSTSDFDLADDIADELDGELITFFDDDEDTSSLVPLGKEKLLEELEKTAAQIGVLGLELLFASVTAECYYLFIINTDFEDVDLVLPPPPAESSLALGDVKWFADRIRGGQADQTT